MVDARGETRTRTLLPAEDFESYHIEGENLVAGELARVSGQQFPQVPPSSATFPATALRRGSLRRSLSARFASRAHTIVWRAVRAGELVRPECCSACGDERPRIEGHHEDYGRPLDVDWLCVRCHKRRHGVLARSRLLSIVQRFLDLRAPRAVA